MTHHSSVPDTPDDQQTLPQIALATDRHIAALKRLNAAFDSRRPAAVMIGETRHEFSHVIAAFLAGLGDSATSARLQKVCPDALAAMRELNSALGFEAGDLCLDDLRGVLAMFLEYQRNHGRRTVICVEQAGEQSPWLLDIIAELVVSEAAKQYGLMVIVAGDSRLDELLDNEAFSAIRNEAARPIRLAPFTLAETRAFVRQRIEVLRMGDISRVFDFDAVDRLHKLSGGIPDTVGKLCQECLCLTDQGKNGAVTAKLVVKAATGLRLNASINLAMGIIGSPHPSIAFESRERLLVRYNGALIQEIELDEQKKRFLVGRAHFANICLPSCLVSRRHALLVRTNRTLEVIDLGSTNGTYIAGIRIDHSTLEPGSVVTLGDCEIEFAVA